LRNENQEILFIVFLLLFMGAAIVHMCGWYIRTKNVEQYSTILVLLYSLGGALCIFSSTFLVSGATAIENGYSYAADMLYNFQHFLDDHAHVVSPEACTGSEYQRGCDSYEMAKDQADKLEQIYRICGEGSRYSRYYQSGKPVNRETVEIGGETYTREELKLVGFCSRDGFKFAAALLAILMGVVSSAVPVVYCCDDKEGDEEPEEAPAKKPGKYTPPPPPQEKVAPAQEEVPPEPDKEPKAFDPDAAIQEFTEYVEKASDEDEKDSKKKAREPFDFPLQA